MLPPYERVPKQPFKKRGIDLLNASKDALKGRRVSKEEYMERLDECYQCPYMQKRMGTCRLCNCVMKIKALAPSVGCPIDKWLPSNSGVESSQEN